MTLQNDKDLFEKAVRETADNLNIRDIFIEKDYWITLVLKRLADSEHVNSVVFKGGTSLSKGFKLINRFSEDIDIAVIEVSKMSGNRLKTFIRTIEKEISRDLEEEEVQGITSKGSRYRKSVYNFPGIQKKKVQMPVSDSLIIEINSFANPYPYEKRYIQSLIGQYMQENNQEKFVKEHGLESFEINILNKTRTLIEKLVSLIRFSFDEKPVENLSDKIRHFYDLYYLVNDTEGNKYIHSNNFIKDFNEVVDHDKKTFDEPKDWNTKNIIESPLIKDFDDLWKELKNRYNRELSELSYAEIPKEKAVADKFKDLITILKAKDSNS